MLVVEISRVDRAVEAAAAGRARAHAARVLARAERERVRGLRLLDAELERLSASSPAAASVIAAVGRDLCLAVAAEGA